MVHEGGSSRWGRRGPGGYFVIVARDRGDRLEFWRTQFGDHANVEVFFDRRLGERRRVTPLPVSDRRRAERRRPPRWEEDLRFHPVVVIPRVTEPDDQARLEQWLRDSRDVLERIVPGLLDEHARLRGRVEAVERERQDLADRVRSARAAVDDLRREISRLGAERAALADAARAARAALVQLLPPLRSLQSRLTAEGTPPRPAGPPDARSLPAEPWRASMSSRI